MACKEGAEEEYIETRRSLECVRTPRHVEGSGLPDRCSGIPPSWRTIGETDCPEGGLRPLDITTDALGISTIGGWSNICTTWGSRRGCPDLYVIGCVDLCTTYAFCARWDSMEVGARDGGTVGGRVGHGGAHARRSLVLDIKLVHDSNSVPRS